MKLKIYQKVLAALTITLCALIVIRYGWQGYATVTERPGLWGTIHYYYNLTMEQFAAYNFIVVLLTTGLIFFQTKYLFETDAKKLSRTFWFFGILATVLVLSEVYLQLRYMPKG